MHVVHLSLTNFRNYSQLELDLPPDISVFQGANAQGKTNLLESICFLATNRFSHNIAEKDIIYWNIMREKLPFARVAASVSRNGRDIRPEIIMRPRPAAQHGDGAVPSPIQKYIRINGVARRAVDLIGQLNMVMFSPRDIDLISGEPALRRRYLDITNSQVDSKYLRSLQRYNRVLLQRNHLLRQIASHQANPQEMTFWDQELVAAGSYLVLQRQQTMANLNELAPPLHDQLSGGREHLVLRYRRSIDPGLSELNHITDVEQAFEAALKNARERELRRGLSVVGPHRDDFDFLVNEADMDAYGSRGQQRTVALSLKLAEVKFISSKTSEMPVLLLDDVLSELDLQRRQHLLDTISSYQQVLITTTDLDRLPSDFLAKAVKFTVENGTIRQAQTSM